VGPVGLLTLFSKKKNHYLTVSFTDADGKVAISKSGSTDLDDGEARMSIDYHRDDLRRLITLTFTEPFSFDETLSQSDRQWAEHTWEYAVLYDMRATTHFASPEEIQQGLAHTRFVGGGRPRGPVGVAIPARADVFAKGLHLAQVSGPRRDIEILLTATQIDAWIARSAPRVESSADQSR
jgi:hypothetical protein